MQLYGQVIESMSKSHSSSHKQFSFSVIISVYIGCKWTEDGILMVFAVQCSTMNSLLTKLIKYISTPIGP
jgi:hypothetical protein